MVRAIVAKWDNEYVLRVPKRYIIDNHLKVGDTVTIEEPIILQQNAVAALVRLGKERGSVKVTTKSSGRGVQKTSWIPLRKR